MSKLFRYNPNLGSVFLSLEVPIPKVGMLCHSFAWILPIVTVYVF